MISVVTFDVFVFDACCTCTRIQNTSRLCKPQVGQILSEQTQFDGRLFDIPFGTTTGVGRDYREDGVTPYDYLKVSAGQKAFHDSWMVSSALGAKSW